MPISSYICKPTYSYITQFSCLIEIENAILAVLDTPTN